MSMKKYDVLFCGNYTKDTIITPDGTTYVDGGGMNYAAHASKQLGANPAVMWAIADRLALPENGWKPFERTGARSLVYPSSGH